jgi:hypothetical protein
VKLRDLGDTLLTSPPLEKDPKGCRELPSNTTPGATANWLETRG